MAGCRVFVKEIQWFAFLSPLEVTKILNAGSSDRENTQSGNEKDVDPTMSVFFYLLFIYCTSKAPLRALHEGVNKSLKDDLCDGFLEMSDAGVVHGVRRQIIPVAVTVAVFSSRNSNFFVLVDFFFSKLRLSAVNHKAGWHITKLLPNGSLNSHSGTKLRTPKRRRSDHHGVPLKVLTAHNKCM